MSAVAGARGGGARPALSRPRAGAWVRAGALALLAVLTGCAEEGAAPPPGDVAALAPAGAAPAAPVPPRRRPADGAPGTEAGPPPPGADRAEARRLAAAERRLRASGRLRLARAPADAPVDAARLARTFMDVAFRTEFPRPGRGPAVPLTRWSGEIVWRVGGDGARPGDVAKMARLGARLSGATGLAFRPARPGEDADMEIQVLTADGRRAARDRMAEAGTLRVFDLFDVWLERDALLCFAVVLRAGPDDTEAFAAIGIRAELPPLWRESCFDEEVAQALGLINDDPGARPSIFNDDEEFAFLTAHDEALLRMLYDPALRPGMAAREAAPLVDALARREAARLAAAGLAGGPGTSGAGAGMAAAAGSSAADAPLSTIVD